MVRLVFRLRQKNRAQNARPRPSRPPGDLPTARRAPARPRLAGEAWRGASFRGVKRALIRDGLSGLAGVLKACRPQTAHAARRGRVLHHLGGVRVTRELRRIPHVAGLACKEPDVNTATSGVASELMKT